MRLLAQHSREFDPHQPWDSLEEQVRGESRLFKQLCVTRRSPHTGRVHDFTRLECPDWINVMAFTPVEDGGELLVVEQFRHGIDRSTLEIIGGVCDPGETPLETAKRELREETGHVSDNWLEMGWCSPNPAIQNNRCHFFLARDCRQVGALSLDPSEELRVWAFPWREWEQKLRNGEIHHALVMCAIHCLYMWDGWETFRSELHTVEKMMEG